ncbi:MAG: CHAP domain-containing protein [Acetobacteraceae bacterium]|nr:MAG: CHAP domain-containing protein [Acetobacteraceae bacterium]
MVAALLGAFAASGDAEAAQRDQSNAARPGQDAVRLPGATAQASGRLQARNHGIRQVAATGRGRIGGSHRRSWPYASTGGEGGISCVPYARAVTGMQVTGNGGDWWGNAAGLYDRGQRPEPGAVMAFRANPGMSRGHVAVVRQVLNSREVRIDHANWGGPGIRRGSVMQNISVVDVSDRNDWSAVKVQSGYNAQAFGRTYPTYGFIYNRPDDAATSGTAFAGLPLRRSARYEQVADAPDAASPRGYSLQGVSPMTTARAVSYQPRQR